MHSRSNFRLQRNLLALVPLVLLTACGSSDPECDEVLGRYGEPGDAIEITREGDVFTIAGVEGEMTKDLKDTGTCKLGALKFDAIGTMSYDSKRKLLLQGNREIPKLK